MQIPVRELKRERVSFDKALREERMRTKQGLGPDTETVTKLLTSAGVKFDVTTHAPELETHKVRIYGLVQCHIRASS